MSTAARKKTLRNLIRSFTTGNQKLLKESFTPNATWTFFGTTRLAGVLNAVKFVQTVGKTAFPEGIKFNIKQIIVDGSYGCVRWEDLAFKKGRKYHNYGVFFVQFREEKIQKLWEYIDYERFKAFYDYDDIQRKIGPSAYG